MGTFKVLKGQPILLGDDLHQPAHDLASQSTFRTDADWDQQAWVRQMSLMNKAMTVNKVESDLEQVQRIETQVEFVQPVNLNHQETEIREINQELNPLQRMETEIEVIHSKPSKIVLKGAQIQFDNDDSDDSPTEIYRVGTMVEKRNPDQLRAQLSEIPESVHS